MPLYTYRCPEGHTWEEFRTLSTGTEASEDCCPKCPQVEGCFTGGTKVPSQVSVILRGRGWTPQFFPNREGK